MSAHLEQRKTEIVIKDRKIIINLKVTIQKFRLLKNIPFPFLLINIVTIKEKTLPLLLRIMGHNQ